MESISRAVRNVGTFVLAPRFPERIPPEFYRLTGVVRVAVTLLVIAITFPIGLGAADMGFDAAVFWRIWTINAGALLVDAAIGAWMWKGAHPIERLRALNQLCAVIEIATLLAMIQGTGSVSSAQTIYAAILVVVYRSAFDFRTGAIAFLTLFGGLWTIVILEALGVITAQPLALGARDRMYGDARLQLGAMATSSTAILTAFVTANWLVARFRHQELAMRELRRSLAEEDGGDVGRHSGRTLAGAYLVGALIGAGGIGEVYRARHVRTGRAIAVKIIREQYLADPRMLERFRREAAVLGRIGSPHILEVVDVDEEDGHPFIAVELLEGETLEARIRREGRLAPALVATIVDQIASGLELAHRASVVHRDLKPDNVFLVRGAGGALVAKILDFGIAKIRDGASTMTDEGSILGTPQYMAPEQASGRTEEVGVATDVYALGAIAYAMLAGRPPFEAGSLPALLYKVIAAEVPPIAGLPPDVSAVLARALAKKPADRFPGVRALADALAEVLAPLGAGDGPRAPSTPPPRTGSSEVRARSGAEPALDETIDQSSVPPRSGA